MRSTTTWTGIIFALAMTSHAIITAQDRTTSTSFRPDRRMFARLFTTPRLRVQPPTSRESARERPANRACDGCDERPGRVHLVVDSPRLNDDWLAQHTYQANGGSFGDNVAVADFWYDAVHRRVFSRSLVLHEVDDPADLRLGRAPGRYPNEIDTAAILEAGTTVGHIGFVTWTHNGFGSYFAAIQGAIRDSGSGYLDLVTATGRAGTTRSGSPYDPQELVKHVRLHPSGQLEVGFDTDPAATPESTLLVRGDARVDGNISIGEGIQARSVSVDSLTATTLTAGGGAVPHACSLRTATGTGRNASISCDSGHLAISGGGACASGELRASHPTQSSTSPDGWALTCSRNGAHTVYAVCCEQ